METKSLGLILTTLIAGCFWYTSHEAKPKPEPPQWNEGDFLRRPTLGHISVDEDGNEYITAIRYTDELSFVVVHAPVMYEDGAAYYERHFKPTRDVNNALRRHTVKWFIDP